MRFFFVVLISLFCLCALSSVSAQEVELSRPDISASGQGYLKAVRYRGIDTDVVYFDPTQPAPPLDTEFTPDAGQSRTVTVDNQWVVGIISAVVLIFLIVFVYFAAGKTSVSLRSSSENARRKARLSSSHQEMANGEIPDLEAILKLGNRDLAVIGLAQLALSRCLTANEVLFKRSWTHREALRSLPQSLWYIPDLRALVLESERVNFGHRSINEGDFDALISRIRPILRKVGT
ncbi:hypothetical protein HW561_18660 [Rhodobacteraceae bacterium B1Z28]|uniref:DUF4129 domain-containing protein n=1 Tax=Ruegeria haliotis TaxID=2747601 RepID=A0ABX2PUG3_9RHOB|nr:hypothetical protein [Ruegeria haliotis]NVO57823.1 hypothetical protein [Ruegeria haliotis]